MNVRPRPRVLTLGETMGLVRAGETGPLRAGASARITIGGAETNVAIGLSRLGIGALWLGRVGDDAIGEAVLAALRAEGVELAAEVDGERPTGLMVKESRVPGASRVSYYRSGSAASAMSPELLRPELFEGVELLHLTGITPALSRTSADLVHEAAVTAREHGVRVSLDVNYRSTLWSVDEAREGLQRLLPLVDVLFGGHGELFLLCDRTDRHHVADDSALLASLADAGSREVVLKRGDAGAASHRDGAYEEAAAFPVEPVDTVGAGDAFVAGYLAAVLESRSPVERLRQANACGALACLNTGDWEGTPTRRDLSAFLDGADPVVR
ncbi:sugar kinase [Streptomyces sp. RY43-2]|uniref:Sugar kinase n=1 Tax=Streptomyces macrolidinus TaxID=2952607 RepID=A0ABT0ZJP6_9ACTN|nr:sugar kinase [Streptomyces macrolidinus]MCN9243752.1 sugar kinase [Streptomyces macrolidinus]